MHLSKKQREKLVDLFKQEKIPNPHKILSEIQTVLSSEGDTPEKKPEEKPEEKEPQEETPGGSGVEPINLHHETTQMLAKMRAAQEE